MLELRWRQHPVGQHRDALPDRRGAGQCHHPRAGRIAQAGPATPERARPAGYATAAKRLPFQPLGLCLQLPPQGRRAAVAQADGVLQGRRARALRRRPDADRGRIRRLARLRPQVGQGAGARGQRGIAAEVQAGGQDAGACSRHPPRRCRRCPRVIRRSSRSNPEPGAYADRAQAKGVRRRRIRPHGPHADRCRASPATTGAGRRPRHRRQRRHRRGCRRLRRPRQRRADHRRPAPGAGRLRRADRLHPARRHAGPSGGVPRTRRQGRHRHHRLQRRAESRRSPTPQGTSPS